MKVHHIGYYVENMLDSIDGFLALGYEVSRLPLLDEGRNVRIAFLNLGNCCVELIEPLDECDLFSKKMRKIGTTPYHICYETNDIDASLQELQNKGYVLVRDVESAPALDGCKVAFLYSIGTGQIELVELRKE